MTERKLKRMLKLERKQIEKEIFQQKKNRFSFYRKRLVVLVVTILMLSSVAFAYHQLTISEWFSAESLNYDQILVRNPTYRLDMDAKNQDVVVTIEGFVTDELNTYLYYNIEDKTGRRLRVSREGIEIENADTLFKELKSDLYESQMPKEYVDENFKSFYHAGSSTLASENINVYREVIRFDPVDVKSGTAEVMITQLVDENGDIIEGKWSYELPFDRYAVEKIEIGKEQTISLPYKDEEITLKYLSLEKGITATRLSYTETKDKDNLSIDYNNFMINDEPLRKIFFGSDNQQEVNQIDFFPVEVKKIRRITCELELLYVDEPVLEIYPLEDFPVEIEYKGETLLIEESFTDRYQYTITDDGYKNRDFHFLEFEFKFGKDLIIMQQVDSEGYLVFEDGNETKIVTFFDGMMYPEAEIRTKKYILETHFSDEELKNMEHYEYNGESANQIRIRREFKKIRINKEIIIYSKWFW